MSLFDDDKKDEKPTSGLSKALIVYELRKFIIEPYIKCLDPDYLVDDDDDTETTVDPVKPNELLKAYDMVCKLSGYYDTSGAGDDLPKTPKLLIP